LVPISYYSEDVAIFSYSCSSVLFSEAVGSSVRSGPLLTCTEQPLRIHSIYSFNYFPGGGTISADIILWKKYERGKEKEGKCKKNSNNGKKEKGAKKKKIRRKRVK
jgi:hypothetical protein